MKTYLKSFSVADRGFEANFIGMQRMTCYASYYPFGVFEARDFDEFEFEPITIFYGSNGSGKSTLLNVIAEALGIEHMGPYNTTEYMENYIEGCSVETESIPPNSRIISSDDVFNYLTDIRYMNMGIDAKRVDLLEEYYDNKKSMKLHSIDDYENYKRHVDATRKTASQFVKSHLISNAVMQSNGQSAIKFFTSQITQDALYLLDEPENSLSPNMQLMLKKYIEDSVVGYNCQFVIATHSPLLLSLKNARIYNLDDVNGSEAKWTELENTRIYYEFFKEHEDEFNCNN